MKDLLNLKNTVPILLYRLSKGNLQYHKCCMVIVTFLGNNLWIKMGNILFGSYLNKLAC